MRVHVVIASIIVVFAVLHIVAYIVYAASGSIGCSAGATREWTRQASAAVGAYIQFETTLSKGSGGSTTSMRLWNYIHGLQVYYDSFYGGFGYGSVTRNYYFVLIGTALDTNVTFTHKVGAFPTSCETYGSYSTNFDTADVLSYAAGDELVLNSTYTYIYAPQPQPTYFYVTLGFRFSGANVTAVTEYTLADIFGLLKVNQRYSPEANITHNYIIIKSSDNSIQLKANSRDLQIVIYMKWDSAANAFYISWVEFNNYKIYVQQHATANAITIKSDPRFANALYLPQQAVSQDLLEPMFQSQGYITVPVAYLYYDVMNTQVTQPETVQWWYDPSSDTAYYKLSVSPTPQANITLYSYKLPIYVQNNAQQDITNYAVRITIDAGVVPNLDQINTSTIYFADAGGNPLYYWVEEYDPNVPRLTAWVKVPSIPASGTATIYMHWGDPNANYQSYSNGSNVFIFFDHFDTGTLLVNESVVYSIANSELIITDAYKNGVATWVYDTSDAGGGRLIINTSDIDNIMIIARQKMLQANSASNMGEVGLAFMRSDKTIVAYAPFYDANAAYIRYETCYSYTFITSRTCGNSINIQPDTYYYLIAKRNGQQYRLEIIDDNYNIVASVSGTATDTIAYIGIAVGTYGGYPFAPQALDYIIVTKYIEPEPSVSFGSATVDRPVGWELWWPRQVSFQFDGDVVVDYVLVGASPSDAFVSFDAGSGKSTVWLPYPKHPSGFVNYEVYWHVGNASAYGLAPTDGNTGGGTGGGAGGSDGNNTLPTIGGGNGATGFAGEGSKLFLYMLPLIAGVVSFVVWGVSGLGAAAIVNMYLAIAGVGEYWISYLLVLGLIVYVMYRLTRGETP